MDINLKEFYYDKLYNYAINSSRKSYRSFRKNRVIIKEAINKIVDDHNDYLLTESFINYIVDNDLHIRLTELASNNKYVIYEMFSLYYQELLKYFSYSSVNKQVNITDNKLTSNLDLKTKEVLTKVDMLFLKMCRMNDLNIYYFALMKLTILYLVTYCHLNNSMDRFDEFLDYYQNNLYKIKDEIIINGIDISDTNNELIDIISSNITNRNKKLIK